jgi:predicted TPR repeat methyltransferase
VGLDLSARMVARARALELYDELVVADLVAWLDADGRADGFDAIVAADVLVYFGDLAAPLHAAARALRPGGVLVFSTERGEHGGFALEPSGRFSHDPCHIQAVAMRAGLEPVESSELSYRVEGGVPVAGRIDCLRRMAGARRAA